MKNNFYTAALILLAGQCVYAGAIIEKSDYLSKPRSIQSSSIIYSNVNTVNDNIEIYKAAAEETKKKIEQNPNDYEAYINLAGLYIKTGEYQKACDELIYVNNAARKNQLRENEKKAAVMLMEELRKTPKNDKIKSYYYTNAAVLALILNNKQQAADYLTAALSGFYDDNFVKNAVIKVIDNLENIEAAINICGRVLQKRSGDIDIIRLHALYLMQADKKNAAIEEYSKILDLKPDDENAKYSLYKLLSGKNASEKEILRSIYRTDKPDFEKAYGELADILFKNNDISGALYFAKLLAGKYPDNANGYLILSEIYRKEGKLKESYEALSAARNKADTNEEIGKYNVLLAKLSDEPLKEANSLMASGLYKQALEVLESASRENLYVILAQARAEYFLKQKQKSLDLLNKAMALYPDNSDVYCAFSYIYLQEKDIGSARKYINQSLKINPENKTSLTLLDLINNAETSLFHNQISSCMESQNYTEAVRLIDEALKINKKDSMLYYYRGLTYIAQNNYAASTAELYKCLELDKNNILANFYLGIAFDNLAEKDNALMYYRKFINLLPNDDFGESEHRQYAESRIQKLK